MIYGIMLSRPRPRLSFLISGASLGQRMPHCSGTDGHYWSIGWVTLFMFLVANDIPPPILNDAMKFEVNRPVSNRCQNGGREVILLEAPLLLVMNAPHVKVHFLKYLLAFIHEAGDNDISWNVSLDCPLCHFTLRNCHPVTNVSKRQSVVKVLCLITLSLG